MSSVKHTSFGEKDDGIVRGEMGENRSDGRGRVCGGEICDSSREGDSEVVRRGCRAIKGLEDLENLFGIFGGSDDRESRSWRRSALDSVRCQ